VIVTKFPNFVALLALLFPLSVTAEDTPKLEAFGGYSFLRLTDQPRTLFKPASLNGWNVSLKLNVTPRVGLVADFSGHYGQKEITPLTLNSLTTATRQHTYLLGPEVRIFESSRVVVNLRGLIGVAHTNALAPTLNRFTFPTGNNTFAVSLGGSMDYRITNRLSYRIVQPEVLFTRSGSMATSNLNQYNFRMSTGLVFTSGGSSSDQSSRPRLSFGVIGGAALTDAFGHETTGFVVGTNGGIQPTRSLSYSTLKDYAIGPTVEVGLPWRRLSVEIDALYRPMNLMMAGVDADGSLNSISPATVVTWEFPMMAKYRFGSRSVKPFIEAGPSFRASGNLNNASPSTYGGAAGIGLDTNVGKVRIGPLVRYIHWAADPDYAGSRTRRNQVELLMGLSF